MQLEYALDLSLSTTLLARWAYLQPLSTLSRAVCSVTDVAPLMYVPRSITPSRPM